MTTLNQFSRSFISVETFVKRAYSALSGFTTDEIHLRNSDEVKKLVEEIIPIASFLKHIQVPKREIKCQFFPGNQNFDAKLKLQGNILEKGFAESLYFIEVTGAIFEKDYRIREALSRYGAVFYDDQIHRVGSRRVGNDRIVSQAVAEGGEALIEKVSERVKIRLREKASKNYPKPCILLIYVEPERWLDIEEWAKVATNVREHVNREVFAFTYITHSQTNTVFPI